MNKLTTLYPIASLLIIAMWLFYETKAYFAFINWFSKTFTRERIIDFFCNWFELAADDVEKY